VVEYLLRTTRAMSRCAEMQLEKQKTHSKLKLTKDVKNYKKGLFGYVNNKQK